MDAGPVSEISGSATRGRLVTLPAVPSLTGAPVSCCGRFYLACCTEGGPACIRPAASLTHPLTTYCCRAHPAPRRPR